MRGVIIGPVKKEYLWYAPSQVKTVEGGPLAGSSINSHAHAPLFLWTRHATACIYCGTAGRHKTASEVYTDVSAQRNAPPEYPQPTNTGKHIPVRILNLASFGRDSMPARSKWRLPPCRGRITKQGGGGHQTPAPTWGTFMRLHDAATMQSPVSHIAPPRRGLSSTGRAGSKASHPFEAAQERAARARKERQRENILRAGDHQGISF